MFSTCFNFTILGAIAFAKLKLFELAITWCDQGLAVSFYHCLLVLFLHDWKMVYFRNLLAHFRYELVAIFLD